MANHLESEHNTKLHPETIPTVDNNINGEKRVGVVEKIPVIKETVKTTNSTSHSQPSGSKEAYGLGLPILAAIACCIPLAGILGYLIHQPEVRVVTRTVTNTVPVLTVPAPTDVSSTAVGPKVVGPGNCGPAPVGIDRVGTKQRLKREITPYSGPSWLEVARRKRSAMQGGVLDMLILIAG